MNPALSLVLPDSFAFICQCKQVQSCRTWAEHLALVLIPALFSPSTLLHLISFFPLILSPKKQSLDAAFWARFNKNPGDECGNE